MKGLIANHPIAAFITIAYLGSWLLWSPMWLSDYLGSPLPLSLVAGINQLGLFGGPFAAALITSRITEGTGFNAYWRNQLRWRMPRLVRLVLWFIPLLIVAVYLLTGSRLWHPNAEIATVIVSSAVSFFVFFLGGPIQEEPGWRGFLLPKLQERTSPLTAAFIIGVVHCFWHTPLFFVSTWDTARGDAGQYVAYLLVVIGLSVILSWLYNVTNGNLIPVVIGHNMVNWALVGILPELSWGAVENNWPAAGAVMLLAVAIGIMTKGRLGVGEE